MDFAQTNSPWALSLPQAMDRPMQDSLHDLAAYATEGGHRQLADRALPDAAADLLTRFLVSASSSRFRLAISSVD